MPEALLAPLADVYSLSQEAIPAISPLYRVVCWYQDWEGSHFRNRLGNFFRHRQLHRNQKIQQTNKMISICGIKTRKKGTDLHDFQFTFDLVIVVQLLQLKSELINLGGLQEMKLQFVWTDNNDYLLLKFFGKFLCSFNTRSLHFGCSSFLRFQRSRKALAFRFQFSYL